MPGHSALRDLNRSQRLSPVQSEEVDAIDHADERSKHTA